MGSYSVFGPPDPNVATTLARQGNPDYTGVNYHVAAQAIPIPIMWGTRRIAPNIIWASRNLGANISVPYVLGQILIVVDDVAHGGHGWDWLQNTNPSHLEAFAGGARTTISIAHGPGNPPSGPPMTGYGNTDFNSPNALWWMPMVFGLCEGKIDNVTRIWNGGGAPAVPFVVQGTTTDGPIGGDFTQKGADFVNPPPSLFYTIFVGSTTQNPWSYYAIVDAQTGGPYYAGQDLAYRSLAYIASAIVACGHNNVPPQQSFEVVRTPDPTALKVDSYGIGDDYAADAIIADILTNVTYGLGLQSGDIDSASLLVFKQYTRALGIFLSPLLDQQIKAVDFIDRLATETNTWIYWDGTKFRFAALGDESLTGNGQTYTPDTTPAYDLNFSHFVKPGLSVQRADPFDCFNRLRLEFSDRNNDYSKNPIEWKDETLINQVGIRDASSISADDICDIAVAAKVIELAGKRMAYIRNIYTFTLTYQFILLLPGTIVTVSDPNLGLDHVAVRVQSVEENDKGELKITAEEYPGVLGIARPPTLIQGWTPTGMGSQGVTGGAIGGGGSVSTSGGGITMTPTQTNVLFVAGDVCVLPPDPLTPGLVYTFVHDVTRSPQPTPPLLEENPVTFKRPTTGAAYNIQDPQNILDNTGALTPAPSPLVTGRTTGKTYQFYFDGAGLVRCV
jgi:Putative phage tail protein